MAIGEEDIEAVVVVVLVFFVGEDEVGVIEDVRGLAGGEVDVGEMIAQFVLVRGREGSLVIVSGRTAEEVFGVHFAFGGKGGEGVGEGVDFFCVEKYGLADAAEIAGAGDAVVAID